MKKVCNAIVLMMTVILVPSVSATSVNQKTIKQVNVVEKDGAPHVIVKVEGGVPSQNCTDKTAFARPLNDVVGKSLLAAALTAMSTGQLVDVIGNDAYGVFNVEMMQEIRLYK